MQTKLNSAVALLTSGCCGKSRYNPALRATLGGHRLCTILVYLNTLPAAAGGATRFPRARPEGGGGGGGEGLAVQPTAGTAVVFFPATRMHHGKASHGLQLQPLWIIPTAAVS